MIASFVRSERVLWRRLGPDRVMALRPDADQMLLLEGGAAAVWEVTESEITLDAVIASLCDTYATDESSIGADVERAARMLVDHGLLLSVPARTT